MQIVLSIQTHGIEFIVGTQINGHGFTILHEMKKLLREFAAHGSLEQKTSVVSIRQRSVQKDSVIILHIEGFTCDILC